MLVWSIGTICFACAPSRQFHLRGQLDRKDWTVHDCKSADSYRLILTSNQSFHFGRLETKNSLQPDEPLVLDFSAVDLGRESLLCPSSRRVVGFAPPARIERGTCDQTYGELTEE